MTDDLLAQLKAIDPAVLTEVVRQDQRSPDLTILDWTVEPINFASHNSATGGLFLFTGRAQSERGVRPWSVVLKCIKKPEQPDEAVRGWTYWRREILAFQSGLLAELPAGVRAPRGYGVMEIENGAWVWIEHIHETTSKQWSLDDFQRTAGQLGRFQSAYLHGTPLPDQPWLCTPFFRQLWGDMADFLNPASQGNAWQSPFVQRVFDEPMKLAILQLLADRPRFFDINDRLPQVFCHNDAQRRNFIWTHSAQTGEPELAPIDWSACGPGALGNDLGELVGTSLYFFDYNIADAETLEAAVLEGYLSGIAAQQVEVDPRLVRLGYLTGLTYWFGVGLPVPTADILRPESGANVAALYGGRPVEEVMAGWTQLAGFLFDRAAEMRRLVEQLGL
jgi:hypothetical protein